MKTSELTNELDAALSAFQGEMPIIKKDVNVKMKGVSKSGKEFNVDYDYAPLEAIQEIANPLLSKHGLNITQDIGSSFENGQIINFISTRVAHKSGQWKMSKWFLDMTGVTKEQDRGSKITFNKRYSFVAALNIALSDEDNDAVGVQVEQRQQAKPQTQLQPKPTQPTDGVYIFKVGKQTKGKRIDEISQDVLLGYFNWAKDQPEVKGLLKDDLEAMQKYIDEKGIVPF